MKNTMRTLAVSITCLASLMAKAQTETKRAEPGRAKWGIETELISPVLPEVGIFTIKATRTITGNGNQSLHGDLLLGMYVRPNVKHDIVEKINEYLFTVGYRQYFFKGLHAEAQLLGGYAWGTKNKTDGKDYNNAAVLGEVNVGYRFTIPSKSQRNFYILPQAGILQGLSTDIGPRAGKSDSFITGKLLVGIRF